MWLQGRAVELPWVHVDTDKAADGDKDRKKTVAPDRSSPTEREGKERAQTNEFLTLMKTKL